MHGFILAELVPFILPFFPSYVQTGPEAEAKAEILFAGDAMQHSAQISASALSTGGHDYSPCFDALTDYVSAADLAVVNLEAPLGGKPYSGYPCFSAPDEYPHALTQAGFDVLLLANNHILDRRDRGLHRTLDQLRNDSIPHLGVYHNQADRDSLCPMLLDINGFKIALLNYTYGTNGINVTGNAVVNRIERAQIASDIIASRNAGAEIVTVCIHWGDEYKLLPNAAQKQMANWLVEQDVDMIIGGHPHVVQPMEMRTSPTGRPVLLTYSLGNFISNMKTTDTRGGVIVCATLKRDSEGRAYVDSARYLPVFTEPPSASEKNFRVVPAHSSADPRAAAFLKSAQTPLSININIPQDSTFISSDK